MTITYVQVNMPNDEGEKKRDKKRKRKKNST